MRLKEQEELTEANAAFFAASLEVFRKGISEAIDLGLKATLEATSPPPPDADAADLSTVDLDSTARRAFETLHRTAIELGEAVSDADLEVHRKAMKAKQIGFAFKTERMRRATDVSLQNKEVEMHADFQVQLTAQLAAVQSGDAASLLSEVNERSMELGRKLDSTTKRAQRAEDMSHTLKEQIEPDARLAKGPPPPLGPRASALRFAPCGPSRGPTKTRR